MNKEINEHFRVKTVSTMGTEITYNLNKIIEISGDDTVFKNELLCLLSKSLKDATISLLDCLNKKDWVALRSVAHKIKPNIDLLSNQNLLNKISNIEDNIHNVASLNNIAKDVYDLTDAIDKIADDINCVRNDQ